MSNLFREDDFTRLLAFMQANSMATIVSVLDGAPIATHLPILVRVAGGGADDQNAGRTDDSTPNLTLVGHFARSNPQWRALVPEQTAADSSSDNRHKPPESLVIFSGPHAYISPSLYENRESVPTWNFMAVHAFGRPRIFTADTAYDRVRHSLEEMIATFEARYFEQWQELSERYRDGMMHGLVAFEMPVSRLHGKYKLSQNRPETDQHTVAQALLGYEDPAAQEIGREMRVNLQRRSE